jgi:hypothetical protein
MAFSIKQLLFCMAVIAFGLTALANARFLFMGELVDLVTLGLLITVAYSAWTTLGEKRAYRIGFLCWSLLYVWLTNKSFDFGQMELIELLCRPLGYDASLPVFDDDPFGELGTEANNWVHNLISIGNCLILLLFGLVGGWLTVYFYRKRQRLQQTKA